LPLGSSRREVEQGIHMQLDAGFSGLRLAGRHVTESPWILDTLGRSSATPLVCSSDALVREAPHLLAFLNEWSDGVVVAGHFAGPTDPAVFDEHPDVAELFSHERFAVIASRQGLFDPEMLHGWMEELIERVSWDRLMWGSEVPVAYWRNETYAGTREWVRHFTTDDHILEAFYSGNAERILMNRRSKKIGPLNLPFDPMGLIVQRPSEMWPNGIELDDRVAGALVRDWLEINAVGTLGEHLERLIERTLG
jgi:hypothetical protein